MLHFLKSEPKWLARILTKEKTFDVRINDRDYQVGDEIQFLPLEDKTKTYDVYSIKSPLPDYVITYIHCGLGMEAGYVVLGLKELNGKKN